MALADPTLDILVYSRPWTDAYFRVLAGALANGGRVRALSEHAAFDECGYVQAFYRNRERGSDPELESYSPAVTEDIRIRCRVLRDETPERAALLIKASRAAMCRVLDEHRPAAVLSLMVDSYIIDILHRECGARRIPFIGLVKSFVNGYFRVTARGEANELRIAPEREVEQVTARLQRQQYRPRFLQTRSGAIRYLKQLVRENVKWIHSRAMLLVSNDPENYHWKATRIATRYSRKVRAYRGSSPAQEEWKNLTSGGSAPFVFLPLQHYPEATVDYWVRSHDLLRYHSALRDLIQELAVRRILVGVKEHPSAVGHRDPRVLKWLRQQPNVVLIPPAVRSNDLLEHCAAVLVWTGSVGLESLIRGIPVVTLGTPYYVPGDYTLSASSVRDAARLLESIVSTPRAPSRTDADAAHAITTRLLNQLLPGDVVYGGYSPKNPASRVVAEQTSASIAAAREALLAAGLAGFAKNILTPEGAGEGVPSPRRA